MAKRVWTFTGIALILLLVGGASLAESDIELKAGETIESRRDISDTKVEIFLKRDGETYYREYEKRDGIWVSGNEEKLEDRDTGLSSDGERLGKSDELEVLVDHYLESEEIGAEEMPESVDYSDSEYLPPVGNQKGNSCVGWAVGYYLRTFQEGKEQGWDIAGDDGLDESKVFSPYFIYNQINGSADNGSTLQDAGKLLKHVGAATVSDFPEPRGYDIKPSYDIVRKGYKYRIEDFYGLFSRNDDPDFKISSLKKYLLTGDLPIVGVDAGHNWERPYRDENGNYIITTDDSYIGGHAVVVVGYDDSLETPDGRGAFKVLNSWGDGWGNGGYSYVSYEAMTEDTINGVVYTDLERFYVENGHVAYISGYVGGLFKPDRFITRSETAKIILSAGGNEVISGASFRDVGEDHWAKDYIYTAFESGYISGYPDGTFKPDSPITRAEFANIIYSSMGHSIPKGGDYIITKYFYDSLGLWSTRSVNTLGTMGLIGGYPDGSFKPDKYVTRAEAVTILNRVNERVPDEKIIENLSTSVYNDLERENTKHWAYNDIVEASMEHVFTYELDDRRELREVWRNLN